MKRLTSGLTSFLISPLVLGAAVLVLVAAVYSQVFSFQFLPFWDDDIHIHKNPLYAPLSWGSVALFWEGPFQQLFIPVTYTVWAGLVAFSRFLAGTSIAFGPINPAVFHGANLAVHLVSTLMVFQILRRMIPSIFTGRNLSPTRVLLASAGGALAFGIHPIQVEAVAWVSGLRDLLGGAFSFAALSLFLRALDSPRRGWRSWPGYLSATLLLLLALGSKPGSVVTPALALLCGAWVLRARGASLRPLLWLLPWFLLALAEVALTSKAQSAAELARGLVPVWARPLVGADTLAFYLGKLVWPFSLCPDYGRSPNSLLDAGILYWSWLVPVLLASVLLLSRLLRPFLLPFALLVIGVLPTLGLMPFNFQIVSTVSDHYLYLAMLGPALASAMALCLLPVRVAVAAALLLVTGWGTLTLLQLPQWASGDLFFPAILSRNPTSWKSRHNYACTLDAQGNLPRALAEFQEAIRLRPSNAEAHNDLALTLLKSGRRQEAIVSFQNSLQVRPTSGAARNLATVLLMNGDAVKAVQVYRLAMQIDPGDLQNLRALAWLEATHPDERARNGAESLQLAGQIVEATGGQVPVFLLTLSAALAETGDFDRAIGVAERASAGYRRAGDPKTAAMVETTVLPALRDHQKIRDNPAQQAR